MREWFNHSHDNCPARSLSPLARARLRKGLAAFQQSMLKFWRSPKIAHTKERSPSPTPPPTTAARPDPPPPAAHLHGLGLGLPPALGSSAGHVSGQAHSQQGARARTSSAQGAWTSPRSTQTATASPNDCGNQDRLEDHTGILRERNGQPIRTFSAASTSSSSHPAAAPHKPAQVDRSLSPTSLSPSLGHSLGTRQCGGVASIDFADRDPTQIYGTSPSPPSPLPFVDES